MIVRMIGSMTGAEVHLCSIEGCDRAPVGRGWCSLRYGRWHKTGDPGPVASTRPVRRQGACAVNGCDRPVKRREWCGMHHQRWLRYGDPTETHR